MNQTITTFVAAVKNSFVKRCKAMRGSLAGRTFFSMILIVIMQGMVILGALALSGIFSSLNSEASRIFYETVSQRAVAFNQSMTTISTDAVIKTNLLNGEILAFAQAHHVDPSKLYLDDALYLQVADICADSVISSLGDNKITGAFVIFNNSNLNKHAGEAHSAIYIRDASPDFKKKDTSSLSMEVGPFSIAQKKKIALGINWDVDMDLSKEGNAFFYQPIFSSEMNKDRTLDVFGYWSAPTVMFGDNQEVITYTVPLLNENGEAYGVYGIEVSMYYLSQGLLPYKTMPYKNSFFVVAGMGDGVLNLNWYIPSGPISERYIAEGDMLALQDVRQSDYMKEVRLNDKSFYCISRPIHLYSEHSVFSDINWQLTGFVEKSVITSMSHHVQHVILGVILLVTGLAILIVSIVAYVSTKDISKLSKFIKSVHSGKEIQFKQTGLKEIDELTSAIEYLNKSVVDASGRVSRIMELTQMPMGCFEVLSDSPYVYVTDYLIEFLDIKADDLVSSNTITKEKWGAIYNEIIMRADSKYENVFRLKPCDEGQQEPKWVRMLVSFSGNSWVGVLVDISLDIMKQKQLEYELEYDGMTRLYNRDAFKRRVFEKIKMEPEKIGAMIFTDLDNLKYVNDTYGHTVGDVYITSAARLFERFQTLNGIVARISGDEFAIYVHGFDEKEEARKTVLEFISEHCNGDMLVPGGETKKIRYSMGIAWYPEASADLLELIKMADFAMYEAKNKIKGTVFEFDKHSYEQNIYLLEKLDAINRLIEEQLIRFAFQPIVHLETGEIYGYEALMRSTMEEFTSPLEILSVASAQSKLNQIEQLVIHCMFVWLAQNFEKLHERKMFINSIPSQRLTDVEEKRLVTQYGHVFKNLVFEVIEAEDDRSDILDNKLAFMRKHGAAIAIDDFGAGYSNDLRILSIAPDIIKMDMGIIRDIDKSKDKQHLVANIISYCKPKGILLLAEGVETKEELTMVMALGADLVQGYLVGIPAFELAEETLADAKAHIMAIRKQINEGTLEK